MDENFWPAGCGHLKDWARGKQLGLFVLGIETVRAASACHDLLEQHRLRKGPIWELPRPDDSTWFRFYGSHRRLRRGLFEAFGAAPDEANSIDAMLAGLSWCSNADRAVVRAAFKEAFAGVTPADFRRDVQEGRRAFVESVDFLESIDDRATERRILSHPAVVFFLQVAAPVFLRHGEWPSQLLRRATRLPRPDLSAIDQLVRNDRRVRRHPQIRSAIAHSAPAVAKQCRQRIRKAIDAKAQKVRLSTLKVRLSGLISEFAARLGDPIEARNIRDVFNREAERVSGMRTDFDLVPYAGNYRRQVYRGRKHWLRSLPARCDAETLKSVRTLLDRNFYHFGDDEARTITTG